MNRARGVPALIGVPLALCLLAAAGCAAEETRATGPGAKAALVERLVARLRDYVYATYDVDAERGSGPALERLRAARAELAAAMEAARLPAGREGLAAVMDDLRAWFLENGDLVFVPVGEAAGVLLARVAERREVLGREIVPGLVASCRVIVYDDAPIEDVESYRRRRAGRPPARPVAQARGKTIYLDRGVARELARAVVIPRARAAQALSERAAGGERLAPAEEKDLLRHRSLVAEIARGESAVAEKIAAEEELRLAALLAAAPAEPGSLLDPEVAAAIERRATLAAVAGGLDPRYHLASALAAIISAAGTPPATGAARALEAFGERPLHEWAPEALRARALEALKQ